VVLVVVLLLLPLLLLLLLLLLLPLVLLYPVAAAAAAAAVSVAAGVDGVAVGVIGGAAVGSAQTLAWRERSSPQTRHMCLPSKRALWPRSVPFEVRCHFARLGLALPLCLR
tara:strand:+ start:21 stop:353 length:333 start_codon:yes stop_codon:yes gene_type:complete